MAVAMSWLQRGTTIRPYVWEDLVNQIRSHEPGLDVPEEFTRVNRDDKKEIKERIQSELADNQAKKAQKVYQQQPQTPSASSSYFYDVRQDTQEPKGGKGGKGGKWGKGKAEKAKARDQPGKKGQPKGGKPVKKEK